MTREEAREFAESTPEAQAVYALRDGKYTECIKVSVLEPCDTDWVTCIDDAWVVKFSLSEGCGINHDGRADLVLLVDALNRSVISRYPEKEYYLDPVFCQLEDDCLMMKDKTCYNFVHGQVSTLDHVKGDCVCRNQVCTTNGDS